jgi:urocanate hydratase
VVVADGTENSKRRLERVLTSDPGMGILRHADAGYSRAIEVAAKNNIDIPIQRQRLD